MYLFFPKKLLALGVGGVHRERKRNECVLESDCLDIVNTTPLCKLAQYSLVFMFYLHPYRQSVVRDS